jgi:hypothetical protein
MSERNSVAMDDMQDILLSNDYKCHTSSCDVLTTVTSSTCCAEIKKTNVHILVVMKL